jgi:hypothetical protein
MPNLIKNPSTNAMLIRAAESPDMCTSLEALRPKISHYAKSKEGILAIAFQSTVVPINIPQDLSFQNRTLTQRVHICGSLQVSQTKQRLYKQRAPQH